jgi:spoIIIJ-associated protein
MKIRKRKEVSNMQEVKIEAKKKEEAIRLATEKLNASESEIVYHIEVEKGKLFKGDTYKITATTLNNVVENITDFLSEVIKNLGLSVNFESSIRERRITIKMFSDNNPLLIGKNGQTLKALEILTKQYIYNKYKYHVTLSLDVEDYKERKIKSLEILAKKTAKEVITTGIPVSLENMNSFERRVVHNALTNFKGISTTSEGEEPNRHVVIKPID